MPVPRPYRKITAHPSAHPLIRLVVTDVDFAIEVYDSTGSIFSVNRDSLHLAIAEDAWPQIEPDRKYIIRYDNNDGGIGVLNCELMQTLDDGEEVPLNKFIQLNISGPTVFELPFYVAT